MPEAAASRKRADLGPANFSSFSDDRTPYSGPRLIRALSLGRGPLAPRAGGLRIRATCAFRIFHRHHTGPPFRRRRGFAFARGNRCAAIPENVIGQHFAKRAESVSIPEYKGFCNSTAAAWKSNTPLRQCAWRIRRLWRSHDQHRCLAALPHCDDCTL
jgi:hypothetical protein